MCIRDRVIHPKTIKPLQNKKIPLLVKSFLDPELPGTIISSEPVRNLPPVIVVKQNQVLMHFKSKDFSFVEDKPIASLHRLFTAVSYTHLDVYKRQIDHRGSNRETLLLPST